jgi:hypothetical protein
MPAVDLETIQLGWKVHDNAGDDVGDVAEVTHDWVRVHRSGLLSKGDFYVPRSAIETAEEHEVFLNVPKSELSKWSQPPVAGATS